MFKVKPQYAGQIRITTQHTNVLIDNTLTQEVLKALAKKPSTAYLIEEVAENPTKRNVTKKDTVEPQED